MSEEEWEADWVFEEADPVRCVCGSEWFWFTSAKGNGSYFQIDQDGNPVDWTGHPRCAVCQMDYPLLVFDPDTGDPSVWVSEDLESE